VVGGCRGDLCNGGELCLGRVDAQNIAGAGTRVVRIADAEPATNRRLGIDRVSEAQAWTEVGEVGIDQCLSIGSATGKGSDAIAGDGSGVVVRTVWVPGSKLEMRL